MNNRMFHLNSDNSRILLYSLLIIYYPIGKIFFSKRRKIDIFL